MSSGLTPKPKNIKQQLTVDEIRSTVDRFIEAWDDGWRPGIWSSYEEDLVAKLRDIRENEKYPERSQAQPVEDDDFPPGYPMRKGPM